MSDRAPRAPRSRADTEPRSVLITGASGALGQALARHFAQAGYFVGLHYHSREDAARAVLDELEALGATGDVMGVDLTDSVATAEQTREFVTRHGPLDVLVNNAGLPHDQLFPFTQIEDWRRVLDVNLTALHTVTQCVLRGMIARGGGSIVNVSSVSGLRGLPGQAAYAAAKAGVHGFTRSLAREVGRHGVRVNGLAPGVVESPYLEALTAEQRQFLISTTCLGRLAKPAEIARVAVFLGSEDASYITGQIIAVDGGIS